MAEKEKEELEQEQTPQNAEQYVKALKSLRENSVDKEEFDKVVAERDTLIKAMAEGDTTHAQGAESEKKPDIKELRDKLRTSGEKELSNAEFVATALQLRRAVIEAGGIDPFLPQGVKAKPTLIDIQGAERVAEGLQSCLDNATDPDTGKVDNDLFNAHLKKIIAEDNPSLAMRLKANARK